MNQNLYCKNDEHKEQEIIGICLESMCICPSRLYCTICAISGIHNHEEKQNQNLNCVKVKNVQKWAQEKSLIYEQESNRYNQLKDLLRINSTAFQNQQMIRLRIQSSNLIQLQKVIEVVNNGLDEKILTTTQFQDAWNYQMNDIKYQKYKNFLLQLEQEQVKKKIDIEKFIQEEKSLQNIAKKQQLKTEIEKYRYEDINIKILEPIYLYCVSPNFNQIVIQFDQTQFRLFNLDQNSSVHSFKIMNNKSFNYFVVSAILYIDNNNLYLGLSDGQLCGYQVDLYLKEGEALCKMKNQIFQNQAIVRLVFVNTNKILCLSKHNTLKMINLQGMITIFCYQDIGCQYIGSLDYSYFYNIIACPTDNNLRIICCDSGMRQVFKKDVFTNQKNNIVKFGHKFTLLITTTQLTDQIIIYKFDAIKYQLEQRKIIKLNQGQSFDIFWVLNDAFFICYSTDSKFIFYDGDTYAKSIDIENMLPSRQLGVYRQNFNPKQNQVRMIIIQNIIYNEWK
ncbi:hypothetical protein pb186bvf_021218 [Paramecium bursaria]